MDELATFKLALKAEVASADHNGPRMCPADCSAIADDAACRH